MSDPRDPRPILVFSFDEDQANASALFRIHPEKRGVILRSSSKRENSEETVGGTLKRVFGERGGSRGSPRCQRNFWSGSEGLAARSDPRRRGSDEDHHGDRARPATHAHRRRNDREVDARRRGGHHAPAGTRGCACEEAREGELRLEVHDFRPHRGRQAHSDRRDAARRSAVDSRSDHWSVGEEEGVARADQHVGRAPA